MTTTNRSTPPQFVLWICSFVVIVFVCIQNVFVAVVDADSTATTERSASGTTAAFLMATSITRQQEQGGQSSSSSRWTPPPRALLAEEQQQQVLHNLTPSSLTSFKTRRKQRPLPPRTGSSCTTTTSRTKKSWTRSTVVLAATNTMNDHQAASDEKESSSVTSGVLNKGNGGCFFTPEEIVMIKEIHSKAATNLRDALLEAIPTLPPQLVLKLRDYIKNENSGSQDDDDVVVGEVSDCVKGMFNEHFNVAKSTLEELMNAGEIRTLDTLISKAIKDGRIDVAFFNVLSINLKDAIAEEEEEDKKLQKLDNGGSVGGSVDGKATNTIATTTPPDEDDGAPSVRRSQILQHIYTRCQEEFEKTIEPGMALLNKLLRTKEPTIRSNIYSHYLTPNNDNKMANKIVTPDGRTIEINKKGKDGEEDAKALVSHVDFMNAIRNTVKQIRTVEATGGADRSMAANMVESCRRIAKETRIVIGESYGRDSKELASWEDGLQPVFRPTTTDSPYIQGEKQ